MPGHGRQIALDVARGLHFLHRHFVVHFDLKSPNILLGRNNIAKCALSTKLVCSYAMSCLWRTLSLLTSWLACWQDC